MRPGAGVSNCFPLVCAWISYPTVCGFLWSICICASHCFSLFCAWISYPTSFGFLWYCLFVFVLLIACLLFVLGFLIKLCLNIFDIVHRIFYRTRVFSDGLPLVFRLIFLSSTLLNFFLYFPSFFVFLIPSGICFCFSVVHYFFTFLKASSLFVFDVWVFTFSKHFKYSSIDLPFVEPLHLFSSLNE